MIKTFAPIRRTIVSKMTAAQIRDAVQDEFVEKEKVTPDALKGRKGLVVVHRGANYRVEIGDRDIVVKAYSPRSGDSGGKIFTARCAIAEQTDGTSVEVTIGESWGIVITIFAWIAVSAFGLIWNVCLSFQEQRVKIELIYPLILIGVGVFMLMLARRSRRKSIEQFVEKLRLRLEV